MKRRDDDECEKNGVFAVKRDEWMMDASVEWVVVMKICVVMLVIGLCSEIGARIVFNGMVWTRLMGGKRKGGRARRLVIYFSSPAKKLMRNSKSRSVSMHAFKPYFKAQRVLRVFGRCK